MNYLSKEESKKQLKTPNINQRNMKKKRLRVGETIHQIIELNNRQILLGLALMYSIDAMIKIVREAVLKKKNFNKILLKMITILEVIIYII